MKLPRTLSLVAGALGATVLGVVPVAAQGVERGGAAAPVVQECAQMGGRLIARPDTQMMAHAPSGDFSVVLPGRDWCEVQFREHLLPSYMQLGALAEPGRRQPEPAMPVAIVHIQPLLWRPNAPFPTAQGLHDALQQQQRSGSAPEGFEQFTAGFAVRFGLPGYELGTVRGENHCVSVRNSGDAPIPRGGTTHFEIETHICVAPLDTQAGAIINFIFNVATTNRRHGATLRDMSARFFASLRFARDRAEVSAECAAVKHAFETVFPRCMARARVACGEPGAPGAAECASGCLAGWIERSPLDEPMRRRCYAEVLRHSGFRDALPLEATLRALRQGR